MSLDASFMPKDKSIYDAIIDYVTKGAGAGAAYNNLATFVDYFGSRLAGSQRLEESIDHVVAELQSLGSLQVHTESFSFEGWQRGVDDSALLLLPFAKRLPILALGSSVSTASPGDARVGGSIEANCVVVESFDELDKIGEAAVRGNIVVYNQSYQDYPVSVQYRVSGASRAAKYGAVAAMVRSVTPFSIGSPHTGMQEYDADVINKIPVCCITVEDAELLHRAYRRGDPVRVSLQMACGATGKCESRNIVADLVGSELPQELVVICGHLDSWDVGQGAMDDGGGAFTALQALRTLLTLNQKPKRTIRLVLFSGEEFGLLGGKDYYQRHHAELADKLSFMLESDSGTFSPSGVTCSGSNATRSALQQIMDLLKPIDATRIVPSSEGGPDITFWADSSVPIGNLMTQRHGQPDDYYFYFHHSEGDMMTVQSPVEMDMCVASFAVIALALANAPGMLPRSIDDIDECHDADWELV